MFVSDLLEGVDVAEVREPSMSIKSLAILPQQVRRETMFVKPGYRELRATTAAEAIKQGARYIVIDEEDEELASLPKTFPLAVVRGVKRAYAILCANFFGNVHRNLNIIGVTGTKGKTTTCHLLDAALRAAGLRTGLVSSLVRRTPDRDFKAPNTTPEPLGLHYFLYGLHSDGVTHVVLEVSSIGIVEERVHGVAFDAVGFTNLGMDHYAYHGGRDAYISAKRRIFSEQAFHSSPATLCAINVDDDVGRTFTDVAVGRVVTFGLQDADLTPESYTFDAAGIALRLDGIDVRVPLVGAHNVYNTLAALTIASDVLGSRAIAAEALRHAQPLPGRLERIPSTLGVVVYVDYAHTPESVQAALSTVRALTGSRRCIAVVGCSGNSDRAKRAPMARAAVSGADYVVLTSDNPDREHPGSIVRDMLLGAGPTVSADRLRVILDRRSAIATAIELAMPNGVVVLLGKGTEEYQLVNGQRIPHSDAAAASMVLRELEVSGGAR